MNLIIEKHREVCNEMKIKRKIILEDINELTEKCVIIEKEMENYKQARYVLADVVKQTQMFFKKEVENLTTMFLQAVYGNKYKFIINFDIKRNKAECQLLVQEGDNEPYIPKESTGGGVLDTISTALKIVMWSLQKPRTRNTIILDEPAKFLGDLLLEFIDIIKELSEKLNLQFIIITHNDIITEKADRIFDVRHINKRSIVSQRSTK